MKMRILDLAFEQNIDETADHAASAIIEAIRTIKEISNVDISEIEDTIAYLVSDNQREWYKKGFQDGFDFKEEMQGAI